MVQGTSVMAATFVVYLGVVLVIGLVAWRRTRDLADYLLGGRRLGSGVAALSAQASDMSGWLLLGLPGYAYASGLASVWLVTGLLAGTYLNWKLVAGRLRTATELHGDSLTLPDYFENRFDDASGLLRIISAVFILVFFTFYTSSGLVAGGKLFETVFGLPYSWAVLAGGTTIVVYTFIGGFLAVSWTDFVQGSLMLLALGAVAFAGMQELGGWSAFTANMSAIDPALLDPFTGADSRPLGSLAIVSLLGWGLGYFGQPHILARFMATRSEDKIPVARRIAMSWVSIALVCAALVGLEGRIFLPDPLQGADAEKVFLHMATALFPPVLAGTCLAGVLAAVMSTADSQLLVASSALAEDFYRGLFRRNAPAGEILWAGRAAVILIAAIAFVLALDPESRVLDLVAHAWAGFGAAFGPALVLSLYWTGMTREGALAGIVGGGITVLLWKQLEGGLFDLYEIVPGVAVSTLAIVVTSRLTR